MFKQLFATSLVMATTVAYAQKAPKLKCDVTYTADSRVDIMIGETNQISVNSGSLRSSNGDVKNFNPSVRNCFNLGQDGDSLSIYSNIAGVTVHAGDGNDQIRISSGLNIIYGEEGNDYITGGSNRDFIYGGTGDDYLSGDSDDDLIIGGEGNDKIRAGKGTDTVHGGDGDDRIKMYDDVCEIISTEIVYGSKGDDIVYSCRFDRNDEGTSLSQFLNNEDDF
jgi:Ca2+-binding RTX toxin-like protein